MFDISRVYVCNENCKNNCFLNFEMSDPCVILFPFMLTHLYPRGICTINDKIFIKYPHIMNKVNVHISVYPCID
jgi:hypothetical protein